MFRTSLKTLMLLGALPGAVLGAQEQTAGSSSQTPYVVPARKNVLTRSILTVGDAVNYTSDGITPYRMVGIPDGLGAFDNGDGTFTLLMNHELRDTAGAVRAHGFRGAFISRWVIDKNSLTALHGEDLMQHVFRWDVASQTYAPLSAPVSRFCSGDLAATSAFYNESTGLGYHGYIYLCGEENGASGRAFAHFLDGYSYELPALGKFSWENAVANPGTGDKTVVVGTDDAANAPVYVYVGQKSASPDRVSAAGLSGGSLYALSVSGVITETDATSLTGPDGKPASRRFTLAPVGDATNLSGVQVKSLAVGNGATGFNRPEDASWDPSNPCDLYFVTTAAFPNPNATPPVAGRTRLWHFRFDDLSNPTLGGSAEVLITGGQPDGPKMMDNITVNKRGTILIQEDPGSQNHLAKVWRYSIQNKSLEVIAQHDPTRFTPGAPGFLTNDEESSGIIPMDDILGEGWYLLDVQAHYAKDAELVEGGQLIGLHFAPGQEHK